MLKIQFILSLTHAPQRMTIMKSPFGRPNKYSYIIAKLEEEVLYSPASIAHFAQASNLLLDLDTIGQDTEKKRIRLSLCRLASAKKFPLFGDAVIFFKGQAPIPAWYGWRWKAAIA